MGKIYRRKKRSCHLCKPHKAGLEPKNKKKVADRLKDLDKEALSEFLEVLVESRREFKKAGYTKRDIDTAVKKVRLGKGFKKEENTLDNL